MSTKHTPGPWVVDQYGQVITPSGKTLHMCGVAIPHFDSDECRANARLLAAAPEMLDALSVFTMFPLADMRSLGADEPYTISVLGRHMHAAIDAIVKATGGIS